MKLDLHCHTRYSIDSIIRPKDLAKKSDRTGIIPAVTDHNTIDAHREMRSLGAKFIPGEEIRTDRGDLIGLYLNENIPRMTPFAEAIDKVHGQGGIAYLPHMYDRSRKGVVPGGEEAKKLDIIEVFNSRCPVQEYNLKAREFSELNKKIPACGSDSHFLFEFGSTYNEVPDFDISDPKAFLRSIREAKLATRKAPLFVRGTTTMVALTKKLIRRIRH
ncbi:MAG TPA: PHP-associated domain-containing protein [Candidatus Bilamarchaeum sp.]|nr:PHP-associated domain-containing protein [Candidatus Bilamarchaeum sp.]